MEQPPQNSLEETMVNLQTVAPGRWDLMFSNNKGILYVEALAGKIHWDADTVIVQDRLSAVETLLEVA